MANANVKCCYIVTYCVSGQFGYECDSRKICLYALYSDQRKLTVVQ
jgi:hypothetical protein